MKSSLELCRAVLSRLEQCRIGDITVEKMITESK